MTRDQDHWSGIKTSDEGAQDQWKGIETIDEDQEKWSGMKRGPRPVSTAHWAGIQTSDQELRFFYNEFSIIRRRDS